MTAVTSPPIGFTLRVPESWIEFDIWRATRSSLLNRLLDERLTESPELAPHRSALSRLLREVAEEAESQGAVFCAVMLEPVDDAGFLAATAMVFHTDGAPDATDNTVDAIAAEVSAHAPSDTSPAWRRVEIVDLPVGRAVRVYGLEVVSSSARPPLDGIVMQTLVPVPGDAGVVNVVLTSPQTSLVDSMLELFDAISDTLAWTPESTEVPGKAS